MPGATPILALPYPVPADTVDVPRDVKALADKLETYSPGVAPPALVSALPATPPDGTEVTFIGDGTRGVLWRLRYGAATAGPYKWAFVGGPPITAVSPGVESTASTAADVDLATPLVLTTPLKGYYGLRYSAANIWNNAANHLMYATLYIAGAIAFANNTNPPGQNLTVSQFNEYGDLEIPNANTEFRVKYKVAAGTGFWQTRSLVVWPIRVG